MSSKSHHPDLLAEIAAYCARNGQSKSAFGLAAVGDPRFVTDLEGGRECRSKTIARVRNYMVSGITWAERKGGVAA